MPRTNLPVILLMGVCVLALLLGAVRLAIAPPSPAPQQGQELPGFVSELWSSGDDSGDGIGVVELEGVIQLGSEDMGPFSSLSSTEKAIRRLREFRRNDRVKAVLLRVNSPGGSLAASQEIATLVKQLVEEDKKPVVVSMGDLAASGGYYISAPATKIIAQPGTLTGSIGVITAGLNFAGLMEKHGVKMNAYTSGPNKDTMAYWREPRPDEIELLQQLVDEAYGQFLSVVSEGRGIPEETLRPFADGRLLLGSQALALKLVDELGGFDLAVRRAAELAELDPENPNLIRGGKKLFDRMRLDLGVHGPSWLAALLGAPVDSAVRPARVRAQALPVAVLYQPPVLMPTLAPALAPALGVWR